MHLWIAHKAKSLCPMGSIEKTKIHNYNPFPITKKANKNNLTNFGQDFG
jgi:hypothetical protein